MVALKILYVILRHYYKLTILFIIILLTHTYDIFEFSIYANTLFSFIKKFLKIYISYNRILSRHVRLICVNLDIEIVFFNKKKLAQ